MSFDDPALVATLAANVGNFRANEIHGQDQLALQQALARQHPAPQPQMQPEQPPAAPTPGWTETLPTGATIFHPPGDPMPQQQAGAPSQQAMPGQGALARGRGQPAGGGYVTPVQRMMMARIQQMEDGGLLQPAEAQRWHGIVESGGNPFDKPTIGEQTSVKGAGKADPTELTNKQSTDEQLRGSKEQGDLEKQQYERQRQSIHDQVQALEAKARATDRPSDKKAILDKIDGLVQQLGDLPNKYSGKVTPDSVGQIIHDALWGKHGKGATDTPAPAPVRLEGNTITNAAPPAPVNPNAVNATGGGIQAAAGPGGSTAAKPVGRADMQRFLTLAGGDVNTAKALAVKSGFDPNQIAPE
ncbi:MAG TPA: hypothetical protein VG269_26830 [Tepidisphaeraceae bacterium]|jgi:hypothetical protein|nr:hypothetical protein [Tepidisphaeraceae bacterium]